MIWPLELSANLCESFMGVYLVTRLSGRNLRKFSAGWIGILVCFSISTAYLFIDGFSILHSLLITLVLFVIACLGKKRISAISLLPPLLFEAITILSQTIIAFAFASLSGISINDLITDNKMTRILFVILCKLVLVIVVLVTLRFYKADTKCSALDLMLYLFSPAISIMTFYTFIVMCLQGEQHNHYLSITICTVGLTIVNILSLIVFKKHLQSEKETREAAVFSKLWNSEQESYNQTEKLYETICSFRHDMKQQILFVERLIAEGEIAQAENHLGKLSNEVDSIQSIPHTGNRTVDSIIFAKANSHPDVTFIISGELRSFKGIDDTSIVSLMGNMIDNAIEALANQDEKIITIALTVSGGYQNISCKNPISKSVLSQNPELKSSKNDSNIHGYGVKNMRRIVNEINGMIEFYEANNQFVCHILVPLPLDSAISADVEDDKSTVAIMK